MEQIISYNRLFSQDSSETMKEDVEAFVEDKFELLQCKHSIRKLFFQWTYLSDLTCYIDLKKYLTSKHLTI